METLLKSKVLTEDAVIFQIIDIDPDTADLEKIEQILLSYIDPAYSNIKKKILFLEQILDSLWNILERVPFHQNIIFSCFIETIHPIVTNKRDYEYVLDILHSYLQTKFGSCAVFERFSKAMIELLEKSEVTTKEEEQRLIYTSMCFGLILKFIHQSYEINKMEHPDFDATPFESLMRAVSQFLTQNTNERVRGYLFKSLFETETVELGCNYLNEKELSVLLTQEGTFDLLGTYIYLL